MLKGNLKAKILLDLAETKVDTCGRMRQSRCGENTSSQLEENGPGDIMKRHHALRHSRPCRGSSSLAAIWLALGNLSFEHPLVMVSSWSTSLLSFHWKLWKSFLPTFHLPLCVLWPTTHMGDMVPPCWEQTWYCLRSDKAPPFFLPSISLQLHLFKESNICLCNLELESEPSSGSTSPKQLFLAFICSLVQDRGDRQGSLFLIGSLFFHYLPLPFLSLSPHCSDIVCPRIEAERPCCIQPGHTCNIAKVGDKAMCWT